MYRKPGLQEKVGSETLYQRDRLLSATTRIPPEGDPRQTAGEPAKVKRQPHRQLAFWTTGSQPRYRSQVENSSESQELSQRAT